MSTVPAPLSIDTSGTFDGNDGNWSSFTIRVGTPALDCRVLLSTLLPEIWVIDGDTVCTINSAQNCSTSRGQTFFPSQSTSWQDKGEFTLGLETDLGQSSSDAGDYGYDTVGLPVSGAPALLVNKQVVVATSADDFYLGYLGVAQRTPNFNTSTQPSLLQSLKNENLIPSLSYGYTAGAYYKNQAGSLTLGGYDASKFIPNDVSFGLGQIDTHDVVVGVQSISFSSSNTKDISLLDYGSGHLSFIDSTLPNIWLPANVCDAFAQAFGLQFKANQLIYTINQTMHDANVKNNASVTFQLGNFVAGTSSVNITLPYSSFDLVLTSAESTTMYFPIRQAQSSSQYTLGRSFLQEAYLTVDYGNQNFSVSQVNFSGGAAHIVAISANTTSTGSSSTSSQSASPSATAITVTNQSSGLSSSAIAGIAVGIVAIAILLASAIIFVIWRKRRAKRRTPKLPELEGNQPGDQQPPMGFAKPEYFPDFSQKHAPNSDVVDKGTELDGGVVATPSSQHHVTNPNSIPMIELSGSEIQRAELHSPEPDRSRSPTLVNRHSVVTSEPDHPHTREPWTTRLEMPSPGLSSRDSIAAADLAFGTQHSPEMVPSPETELPTLRAGSSTSALQSPAIGYTRYIPSPPASPGSNNLLSRDHESDSFLTQHHGTHHHI